MRKLDSYIVEKLKIDKDINLGPEEPKVLNASTGALENNLSKEWQFMYYDDNSGLITCFECNDWRELVETYSMEVEDAKDICGLHKGSSFYDKRTGFIITRIN